MPACFAVLLLLDRRDDFFVPLRFKFAFEDFLALLLDRAAALEVFDYPGVVDLGPVTANIGCRGGFAPVSAIGSASSPGP